MRPTPASFSTSRPWRLLPVALLVLLSGCETPLNTLRAERFGGATPPATPAVQARALALGLQAAPDSAGLSAASLREANALLTRQGRLGSQLLTLTPFTPRGQQLAQRLASALERSGAQAPRVEPIPADSQRLAEASRSGWDLELQSEAMVLDTADCRIADASQWAVHPYAGIGPLGCANRANVARMASDPRDLQRPRTLGSADGRAAAAAVERYQTGNVRDLIDIDFND